MGQSLEKKNAWYKLDTIKIMEKHAQKQKMDSS